MIVENSNGFGHVRLLFFFAFRVGMHSRTAIRFYEIHTPLTEAVLLDSGKQLCLCVISYYEEKRRTQQKSIGILKI
jgi:hypothetical protein